MAQKMINTLKNRLLVAMPALHDPYFAKSVVYIFEHNDKGAMGIVINKPMDFTLGGVMEMFDVELEDPATKKQMILRGGPIAREQGFIIHREDEIGNGEVADKKNHIIISASKEDLINISRHNHDKIIVSLGYAGWEEGQLEEELLNNSWLVAPLEPSLLFDLPYEERWRAAAALIGVNFDNMVDDVGHA